MSWYRAVARLACLLSLLTLSGVSQAAEPNIHAPPKLPAAWKAVKERITRVAISADGKWVATLIAELDDSSRAGAILYERSSGKKVRRLAPRVECSPHLFGF